MEMNRLETFYLGPNELLFIDEKSKDGRNAVHCVAWSRIGTKTFVSNPFSRIERLPILAAIDVNGFFCYGAFNRIAFHDA